MTNLRAALLMLLIFSTPAILRSQEQAPPLDGPSHIFHDELLDNMAGTWNLTGKIGSQPMNHSVVVEWVLNHQFLRVHEKDLSPKENTPAYEAMVFVGRDNASERYVGHWLDIFGGRYSETLGYGARNGDAIEFVFEYPDGPFHTTFRWNAADKTWHWLMKTKDKSGKWVEFGSMTLTKVK